MRALLLTSVGMPGRIRRRDDWAKVKALKTGAELRVFKKGSTQPISSADGRPHGR